MSGPRAWFPDLAIVRARRLSRGRQAVIWLAATRAGTEPLVLKQYRRDPDVVAAVEAELGALDALRRIAGDHQMHGWTIRIPRVSGTRRDPPVLAMTRVPGESLDRLIVNGWIPPRELAASVADVFQRYWTETGRPVGDVNLENLLCERQSRQLGIVDPGMPSEHFNLTEAPGRYYPASRDLGCLLHQVLSTNVKKLVGTGGIGGVRLQFARNVIASCRPGDGDPGAFVEEVAACAAAHLRRVRGGGPLRGSWRLAVRGLASRALSQELCSMKRGLACT